MFSLPNYNPLTQTAAIHSLPNIPPFYPSLIIPESPSLASVFICLPFDCMSEWPLVWMTSYSMESYICCFYVSVVKFRCEWVHPVSQNCPRFVRPLIDDELCLCFLAFAPPPHLPSWCSCGVCVCLVWMHSHQQQVNWCFTPSQPILLYQGNHHSQSFQKLKHC